MFEGTSKDVTEAVLTEIYGEEDWSATIRKVDEESEGGDKDRTEAADRVPRSPRREEDVVGGL